MFNFINDFDNYGERKIDRYENDGLIIVTCAVSDGNKPYETAVSHPDYNDGKWVIVEAYNTIDEAFRGHDKWIKTMTTEPLPEVLADCGNSMVEQLGNCLGYQPSSQEQRRRNDVEVYPYSRGRLREAIPGEYGIFGRQVSQAAHQAEGYACVGLRFHAQCKLQSPRRN